MTFELMKSEIVYSGRAFVVHRESLRLPNGHKTSLDIITHPGSVAIIPVDDKGNLLLVSQYRHATGQDLLELPAGTLERDESPETCARRELREETGLAAGRIDHLGGFYLAPGYSTEYMEIYLATNLRPDPLEADSDEFLSVKRVPLNEAITMAERGEIIDSKTLAALFLARRYLEKHE